MKQKQMSAILMLLTSTMLTACSAGNGKNVEQVTEIGTVQEQTQETENQSIPKGDNEIQTEEISDLAKIDMPILDEINQNVSIGTTGAYMTAVKEAVNMLDWGTNTGLDPQEIKEATTAWLMDKGNDEQVAFAEKLKQVDDAYHKLLKPDAKELLESAGCKDAAYPWSDAPVETIEAVMDAVGLRPYEEENPESDDWKVTFEDSLMKNYQMTVEYYEDLGDGVYKVYVVIDGKSVPYVTVDSKTGDYHG